MRFKNLGLLTLLISLFILGACQDPSTIGLDVNPDLLLNAKVVDTSTIHTKLVREDEIITNQNNKNVLGYLDDPQFGKTTANLALALTLPTVNVSFGTNPIIDSAVLVLPYGGAHYGDSINYTAQVRQLDELLYFEDGRTFKSNKIWLRKTDIVGSKVFKPSYKDSIIIKDIRVGRADTVKKVIPQLRIPLNNTFINTQIINAGTANLASNKAFADYFKGLHVSLDQTSIAANKGALMLFNTTGSGENGARVDIFYRTTNTNGGTDTTSQSFPINGTFGSAATELAWNFSGTPVATALSSTAVSNPVLYLKSLAGTKVRVKFPYITRLKSLGRNIVINKAELIFTIENGSDAPLKPIPLIRIHKWDIADQPQFLPDENASLNTLGIGFVDGFYNTTSKTYRLNVTTHIQDLVNGGVDYGTFISTYDVVGQSNRLDIIQRAILGGGNNTSGIKTKLKVYYTDQR
ncbi:DUF4270 domain-containing protein [Pedobacter puniceum]|jgi:hypothetical protein|uniref:DUF4270 family protein n=1 Tax=Pedobacter puniceum TaxID=2666136 RepID=A0A7K0FN52_9SPHI|nr:DUF4270 domain-containing protein [Pedobacter puniceum]MRX47409.1 DUF4270 family protein [Pedobacter puniceum]